MTEFDAEALRTRLALRGDEKLTFLLRLTAGGSAEFTRVIQDVMQNAETYIVATTNTVVSSCRPEPFEPVAVILTYEEYGRLLMSTAPRRPDGTMACPDKPCVLCTGNSAVVKSRGEDGKPVYKTSWEWCQDVNTCAATIDWEKVAGR